MSMLKVFSPRLLGQASTLHLRAVCANLSHVQGCFWQKRYASQRAKTMATLEEKRKAAQVGGGQKRIDKQHKTVNTSNVTQLEL